jgi:hypothetical protein
MGQLRPAPARTPPRLGLLGGFNLVVQDQPVDLPIHAQRVLAYLSLVESAQRAHPRTGLADRLWGSVSAKRAQARQAP